MPGVPPVPTFVTNETLTSADVNKLAAALNFALTNRPLYRGHCLNSQAIGTSQYSVLAIDTTEVDTDGGRVGTGSGSERYVCRTPGWYTVSATVSYQSNSTGGRFAVIWVNGLPIPGGFTSVSNAGGDNCGVTLTTLIHMNANDYLQLVAYQDSGVTIYTAINPAFQASAISVSFELTG